MLTVFEHPPIRWSMWKSSKYWVHFADEKCSGRQVGITLLVQSCNKAIYILSAYWWSCVQPLAYVKEMRFTDEVLFMLQWARFRRVSIPVSQEWFLGRGNIKWNFSSFWNHQRLIMSYLMLLWFCRNMGEHYDTSSWLYSAMVSC